MRANRKNLPNDLPADKDVQKGTTVFKEHGNILVMKYRAAKDKSQKKRKIVHLISTKHAANMKNTTNRDAQANVVQKPEAIVYYNQKMGGVGKIDQQLHGIQVLRKTYKWCHKIFFRLLMISMLNAHKLYKKRGGKSDFLQYIHDVAVALLSNAPHLRNQRRRPVNDNLIRLTGRHFPEQIRYEGQNPRKKHGEKKCKVCCAKGNKT